MLNSRWFKAMKLVGVGAMLLQTSGCTSAEFYAFVQTILLGITAAGSVAILQNI
jgi:hypothetical protein